MTKKPPGPEAPEVKTIAEQDSTLYSLVLTAISYAPPFKIERDIHVSTVAYHAKVWTNRDGTVGVYLKPIPQTEVK